MFLRNAWYVAAWEEALGAAPMPITILGDEIVLFRLGDGRVAALEDACPHRKLPLSMGRMKGDAIECGYHGLTFDGSGTCIRAPGSERIPRAARVRAYPVESRYGLVWIWMGAPELADPDRIFTVSHWGDPAWGLNSGDAMEVACNYLYLTDNLLDPSHVAWVHPSSFGSAACEAEPLQISMKADGVTVWRWMRDVEPAPFYKPFLRFDGNCDRKQQYEVRYPCHAMIRAIFSPAGTGGEDRPIHPEAFVMDSYNLMTPIDERRTRYFWFQMRNFAPGDAEISDRFARSVRAAFEEDRAVLEAVQKGMDNRRSPNIDLRIDTGPLRFRQRVMQMAAAEEEAAEAAQ